MTVFDVILWRRAIHYVCLAKSGGKTRLAEFAVLQRAFSSPESPRKWRLQFYICVLEREEAGKEGRGERAGHDSAVGGSCCDAKQRKVWKKKMNWTRHQRGREANCTWWGAVSHGEDILSPPPGFTSGFQHDWVTFVVPPLHCDLPLSQGETGDRLQHHI